MPCSSAMCPRAAAMSGSTYGPTLANMRPYSIGSPRSSLAGSVGPLWQSLSMKIGVLGATGPAGGGFAARLASVGYDVIAGSRDPARAEASVAKMRKQWGDRVAGLQAGGNADAAAAEVVVIGTQWEAAIRPAQAHQNALAGTAGHATAKRDGKGD